MRIILYSLVAILMLSCSSSGEDGDKSRSSADKNQLSENSKMQSKTAPVEDREPEIEMINIDWVFHQDSSKALYKGWIQNKDSKYYLTDGLEGDQLSIELTGGHPAIQLIIISPEEKEVFRQNLGDEPIVWTTTYPETGRYTLMVQLDSKFVDKEQLKTYFEIKMRLY